MAATPEASMAAALNMASSLRVYREQKDRLDKLYRKNMVDFVEHQNLLEELQRQCKIGNHETPDGLAKRIRHESHIQLRKNGPKGFPICDRLLQQTKELDPAYRWGQTKKKVGAMLDQERHLVNTFTAEHAARVTQRIPTLHERAQYMARQPAQIHKNDASAYVQRTAKRPIEVNLNVARPSPDGMGNPTVEEYKYRIEPGEEFNFQVPATCAITGCQDKHCQHIAYELNVAGNHQKAARFRYV